ncbi:putative exonuclease domain-containing protein [Senna tora]|uniref:Putative exonuclease domain-containing protein n=1 Tax=Senna tora TaxID=362788 RepID=A0A834WGM2_9FABA|nr:putative exonuclease domain-containing protein [Senna tora]
MEDFFLSFQSQKKHPEKHNNKKRLTEDQVSILEKNFACNKKLESEQKLQLSNQLGVPPRQIAIWYQNKRARWKTQSLEEEYGALQIKVEIVMAEKKQLERDVERLKAELKEAKEMVHFMKGGGGHHKNWCFGEFSTSCEEVMQDTRRVIGLMKEIAVDLEKDMQSDMVKNLEDSVAELLDVSEDFAHFSSAVQSVADKYQPGEELTDFKKLFEDETSKFKANASSDPRKHPLMRQFKEAVWNVHHEGQPMPGEEQEDIIMTHTQCNILNIKCPLTGKPVTELAEPVRSMECRHIYEKKPIMQYIKSKNTQCPISGCPKILQADKVMRDPLLLVEIDELRKMNKETDLITLAFDIFLLCTFVEDNSFETVLAAFICILSQYRDTTQAKQAESLLVVMALHRIPLRQIFSHRLVSRSPLISNYLPLRNPSPSPFRSLTLFASLSSTAQHPSSHDAGFRWKPMCLYHTQGKCTKMDDPIHMERFNHDCSRELRLNIAELNKIRSQKLDFFLVLDLEGRVEILEFPVLMISAKTMEVEDIFHRFVRPTKMTEQRINEYIEGKYGKFGVDRVWHDTAIPFKEVIQQFEEWLAQHQLWMGGKLNRAAFVTWQVGNWDLKTKVPQQCEVSKIKLPPYFMEWINLKDVYLNFYNRRATGMVTMMKELQIPLLGSHHLGIDDTKNIARVVQHMLLDGALMQITARRNPNSPGDVNFLFKNRIR